MHRREVLKIIGAAAAVPFIPARAEAAVRIAESIHRRIAAEPGPLRVLSPEQNELVTTLAELIIPETDTPGATSVHVNEFLDLVLAEWSTDEDRERFLKGLDAIDRESRATYGKRFVDLSEPERTLTLRALDASRDSSEGPARAFGEVKRLTVYAYFTSEPVQQKVLKTQMWPGRYDGCVEVTLQGSRPAGSR
jgi:hypothetical protein